jgi:hypothetical protein
MQNTNNLTGADETKTETVEIPLLSPQRHYL